MDDPILNAADQVTGGDALFSGESQDCYLVHMRAMEPGEIYRNHDGSVELKIIRRATVDEYLERCPHIPDLIKPERYFIYLTRRMVN